MLKDTVSKKIIGVMVAAKHQVIYLATFHLETNLTAVNMQVNCSAAMEPMCFKSLLNFLLAAGLKIGTVVTDRSTSVRNMLVEDFPDICHQFDIWYVYI